MVEIGHLAQQAGFDASETTALIGLVNETAFNAARDAASRAAMAMVPRLLNSVRGIHEQAALRTGQKIAEQITAVNGGINKGMLSNHTNCVNAAIMTAQSVAGEPAQRRLAGA
jgi:hypothetical protein